MKKPPNEIKNIFDAIQLLKVGRSIEEVRAMPTQETCRQDVGTILDSWDDPFCRKILLVRLELQKDIAFVDFLNRFSAKLFIIWYIVFFTTLFTFIYFYYRR